MSRTLGRWQRTYINGYNLSGYVHDLGPFSVNYDTDLKSAQEETIKGTLLGAPTVTAGTLNGIFDNTATTGLHTIAANMPGGGYYLMSAIGLNAAPALGDPVFCAKPEMLSYHLVPGTAASTVTMTIGQVESGAADYDQPWGVLLAPSAARTGANTATGVDNGAATTAGGWMMYQVFAVAGVGNAVISVDRSTDNVTYTALSGCTATVASTAMPTAGVVQLSKTATIPRYLRWQLSLTGITSITFALAFMRGK